MENPRSETQGLEEKKKERLEIWAVDGPGIGVKWFFFIFYFT